jgi:hypothetical protein
LGLVIEYFADEKQCAPRLKLPMESSAIEVGPGERGRELILFDISQPAPITNLKGFVIGAG